MSNSIQVPDTVGQSQLETLAERIPQLSSPSLELPAILRDGGILGLEARLIHLIVQWARSSENAALIVPREDSQSLQFLQRMCSQAYGLTALALAPRILTGDGTQIPTKDIRGLVARKLAEFEERTFQIFGADEGYSFVSIYGDPGEHGSWLFSSTDSTERTRLRTAVELGTWFEQIVTQIIPQEFLSRFDAERRSQLAAATYELLENAHLHGRLNKYAEPIPIGVTGVSLRVVSVPYEATGWVAGGSTDVALYFLNRMLKDASHARRFLEVTVFDSGIGYHNWINAECNDSAEIRHFRGRPESDTVRDCILKHATSKTTDGSGVGLFRVARLLKQLFGFVRIRTGRTCYFARLDQTIDGRPRVYGDNLEETSDPQVDLRDWFTNRTIPESCGTAVTLCVPLTQRVLNT